MADCITVGVPEIAHVVLSIKSPEGSEGFEEQDATVPVTTGVIVEIGKFRKKVYGPSV
ncbi:hypothetical protein LPTSP3_g06990 [Leptospira kobayashii]|uniref:Uncharacterized protein n=1 Tax=Leptospira kobayashii TaxID=1917830 RepID=A0ABM7UGZ3_9LEPT|nr:hypothetical protein LPTSP3_g06990 [Leptospira kobayashii]